MIADTDWAAKDMEPALESEDGKFIPGFMPKFQDLLVQYRW